MSVEAAVTEEFTEQAGVTEAKPVCVRRMASVKLEPPSFYLKEEVV